MNVPASVAGIAACIQAGLPALLLSPSLSCLHLLRPSSRPPSSVSGPGPAPSTAGQSPVADRPVSAAAPAHRTGLPAFPTAEGYGARSVGGRGGTILEVVNLSDAGPGSLRAACDREGARTIVFRVGGVIRLREDIVIRHPFVTIAGQTAPGDGVCVAGAGLAIWTHDVIVRHLSLRPGDSRDGHPPRDRDALKIKGGYNIMLDHLSLSWSIDELLSTWYDSHDVRRGSHDITLQWSILSEALHKSLHPERSHSAGLLVGDGTRNFSIHHNLLAHNETRNPFLKGLTSSDLVNNVIYDWGRSGTHFADEEGSGPTEINILSNYYRPGPSSNQDALFFISKSVKADSRIFIDDSNMIAGDASTAGFTALRAQLLKQHPALVKAPTRPVDLRVEDAATAYQRVLEEAGAHVPNRSEIDSRIVEEVRRGTGRIIDSLSQVGGYPVYRSGDAPADSDHDGMPDVWEVARGLDPRSETDGNGDRDGDGYTNVEEYLNDLAGDRR